MLQQIFRIKASVPGGGSFEAEGPREDVEAAYAEWQALVRATQEAEAAKHARTLIAARERDA